MTETPPPLGKIITPMYRLSERLDYTRGELAQHIGSLRTLLDKLEADLDQQKGASSVSGDRDALVEVSTEIDRSLTMWLALK